MMKVTMYGRDLDVLVMSRAEYELARLMKEPIPKDFGNFVMSPMPGTLISFAVKEGDVVKADVVLAAVAIIAAKKSLVVAEEGIVGNGWISYCGALL